MYSDAGLSPSTGQRQHHQPEDVPDFHINEALDGGVGTSSGRSVERLLGAENEDALPTVVVMEDGRGGGVSVDEAREILKTGHVDIVNPKDSAHDESVLSCKNTAGLKFKRKQRDNDDEDRRHREDEAPKHAKFQARAPKSDNDDESLNTRPNHDTGTTSILSMKPVFKKPVVKQGASSSLIVAPSTTVSPIRSLKHNHDNASGVVKKQTAPNKNLLSFDQDDDE